jgi:transcriptional regulator with XRE-family HTH domain
MDKSIHSRRYGTLLRLLRDTRERAGVTQVDLAASIGETQTFVSKCERGERRLDVIELRTICDALGVSFPDFVKSLDQALGSSEKSKRQSQRRASKGPGR